ncbi:MAG: hypothetical protein KJO54_12715 [Gammaproteobacteria bacterium]|nr:hypothetical protein [Gammaproteobacteria bacterium]NNF60039.1 hypothetical protein [Gammaproteobacteria bacterium]NNM19970.1 hypothetical protein [Gammaproteobacteria bacterium]
MPDFKPVNPTTPIPPTPRTHRDKRRRQSAPQPKDENVEKAPPEAGKDVDGNDGNTNTIDEYA